MKKIILLSILPLVLVAGCTKDEEQKDKVNIPENVSVKVNSSVNLGYVQPWETSNAFIAEVTDDGMITGKHVGSCTVKCSEASCNVTVTANHTLYTEPLLDWGITKAELISRKGQPDRESGNVLMYETGNNAAPYEMYNIKNNVLESSGMMILSSYTSSMTDHITDRYQPIYYDDDYYYFANAYTLSNASIIVVAGLSNNAQYWLVMYTEYTSNKNCQTSKVTEMMQSIEECR